MGDYVDSAGHCPSGRASGPAGLHIIKATVPARAMECTDQISPFLSSNMNVRSHQNRSVATLIEVEQLRVRSRFRGEGIGL